MVKNLPASAGEVRDKGLIPRSGRYPGGSHGNPLQYSCLENPRDRGAWQATVHGVTELDTTEGLSTHTHTHTWLLLNALAGRMAFKDLSLPADFFELVSYGLKN